MSSEIKWPDQDQAVGAGLERALGGEPALVRRVWREEFLGGEVPRRSCLKLSGGLQTPGSYRPELLGA